MSMPEPNNSPAEQAHDWLPVATGQRTPNQATRTVRAVAWTGWHLGELSGVAVPLALAVTVWAWFAVLSALVALEWGVREYRLHRTDTDEQGAQS